MNRKWMAGALAACLVLGSTSIALADSGKSAGKAPAQTSQTQVSQKGRAADRHAQVAALKQELAKLRDLQHQANDLRHQLNSQWSSLRREIGQAMDQGQVDLLKAELPQLQAVHSDLKAAVEQQQQEQVEGAGFASAKKSGDVNQALTRIQAAEARIQARIDAMQKAVDEMKKLSDDLQAKLAAAPAQTVTTDGQKDGQEANEDKDSDETQSQTGTTATTGTTSTSTSSTTSGSSTTQSGTTSTVTP